jgi:hypothetical protein
MHASRLRLSCRLACGPDGRRHAVRAASVQFAEAVPPAAVLRVAALRGLHPPGPGRRLAAHPRQLVPHEARIPDKESGPFAFVPAHAQACQPPTGRLPEGCVPPGRTAVPAPRPCSFTICREDACTTGCSAHSHSSGHGSTAERDHAMVEIPGSTPGVRCTPFHCGCASAPRPDMCPHRRGAAGMCAAGMPVSCSETAGRDTALAPEHNRNGITADALPR